MTRLPIPGQTIGPFFAYALPYPGGADLVTADRPGAIRLHGRVIDGDREPVPDALVELWQADPQGQPAARGGSLHRDGWTFTGWGRAATDNAGRYSFTTLVPGPMDGAAPFFAITVFARGLLDRLFTRAYLPSGDAVLAADPLLSSLPTEARRTLIANADENGFAFDIVLQGERETTFLSHRDRE